MQHLLDPEALGAFPEDARRAVYECIALRRDVRHFQTGVALDPDVLSRILAAAHLAPSVGFSQPWGFVVVSDQAKRGRIRESFLKCREADAPEFHVRLRAAAPHALRSLDPKTWTRVAPLQLLALGL
jgi:nitroreductase